MRIEAKTLDEAIIQASEKLGVSAAMIKYDLIQRPSNGFLGLFRKNAIIQVQTQAKKEKKVITDDILENIKKDIQKLLDTKLYDIKLVDISKCDDYIYIKLDGKDTPLVIGKDGKRYKALSYMLHNFAILKYDVFIRLEVGNYLQEQIEQMENYILSVIDKVEKYGKYTTRPLDGTLLKVVLDRLREAFPNKYVGIKNHQNGSKAITVGDFIEQQNR